MRLIDIGDEDFTALGIRLSSDDIARLLSRQDVEVTDESDGANVQMLLNIGSESFSLSNERDLLKAYNTGTPIVNPIKDFWNWFGKPCDPDDFVLSGYDLDSPRLLELAKKYKLDPPNWAGSWGKFKEIITKLVKDSIPNMDNWKEMNQEEDDGLIDDERRGDHFFRGDLGHGMHQDFDGLESFFRGRGFRYGGSQN